MRTLIPPARLAIYAFEPAGRGDLRRLDGQVRRLADRVAARRGWWAVATYADRGGTDLFARPGLSRLLFDAAYRPFFVVVIDSALRLGWDARARQQLVGRLAASGVRVELLGGSRLGRVAGLLADLVLADDLIGEAVR
ncbi:MAG: recombinase family protein [Acidimicrobiales bacterium]